LEKSINVNFLILIENNKLKNIYIIMNARRFFENIKLDENGNIIIIIEDVVNPINKGISQYNTFQKLQITAQGELKVYNS